MATKIFYNGNRIIVDGHADTTEECRAITAMCDSMANNENFKTIVYEEGHAVFEQVSGGESGMFAMMDFVLTSRYNSETGYSAAELAAKGTIKARLDDLEDAAGGYYSSTIAKVIGDKYFEHGYYDAHGSIEDRLEALEALFSRVAALESKATKTLPYTADELIALLAKLQNLE